MIQPSMPNIIHREDFERVCEVLKRVHHVKHTDRDLRVPMVRWAYRTMCETLTAQALLKLKYEARVVVSVEHVKTSPHITTPIDTMVPDDHNEETTQLCETEHLRLKEEIRRGKFRLCEFEKDWVRLREKNYLIDTEVKKVENEITKALLIEKPRMARQGT